VTQPSIDLSGGPAGLLHLRHHSGACATISLYGAQLLSWQNAHGQQQLYCSTIMPTEAGSAIRGGVPVCFPQFAARGSLPKHGLVRTSVWHLDGIDEHNAETASSARLCLSDNDSSRLLWPHRFLLQLEVELGVDWLSIALNVTNTGDTSFAFSAALHTYLAIADVRQASISGLQHCRYIDSARQQTDATQSEALLRIDDEIDRIYLSPTPSLRLQASAQAALLVTQQGFTDSVVWNPGPAKAALLDDLPEDDWSRMLCIEAAQIAEPVQLAPQATWRGLQRLSVLSA